jgi:hypothetical protein
MSLNGSGVFVVNSSGQPVVSGTLITATAFNAAMQDIAAALSNALYKDGQQLNAANQAMGGFKLTGLGAGAVNGDSVRYEQLTAVSTVASAAVIRAGDNLTGGVNGALTTVASAGTPDIFAIAVGNLIDYTGTTICTGFVAAPQAGAERTLVCAAAAVFTAGANMLIDGVASGAKLTCAAGDKVLVRAVSTTQFRLTVQRYSGLAPDPGAPINSQSAAYTTLIGDAGKTILHPTADNNPRTFTIDSNANVPYPVGTCLTFVNQINTVTIAITADTLTLAGVGTTGSRTLAANGMATALKVTSTLWFISGAGLS